MLTDVPRLGDRSVNEATIHWSYWKHHFLVTLMNESIANCQRVCGTLCFEGLTVSSVGLTSKSKSSNDFSRPSHLADQSSEERTLVR